MWRLTGTPIKGEGGRRNWEISNHQTQRRRERKDFHVHFLPDTADWLRSKRNRNAPTVPAVIRQIVEEAERQDKKRGRG
jgi:hypothetical protein